MGLLQNISLKYAEPYDRTGDTSEFWPPQLNWGMNKYVNIAGLSQKSGIPDGYCPPYSFLPPIKDGGMSSYSLIIGSGIASATSYLTTARAFSAALHQIEGFGEITKATTSLSLLVKFMADLGQIVGSGEITSASILKAASNMDASGLSALTGSGQIDDSPLNLIAWCATQLIIGNGTVTATLKGWCDIAANITSAGDLVTAQSCAEAVWNALAASYNASGSMGEQLNNVGAGANPWTAPIEGAYTAEDVLKILLAVAAGKTTITPGSGETATVVFRDVNDSADRLTASMDGSERTDVILNAD